jgi:hypothetical protein
LLRRRDRGESAATVEDESGDEEYYEDESGEHEYVDEESGEYEYYDEESGEYEQYEDDDEDPGEEVIRGLVILPGSPRAGDHFLLDRDEVTIGRSPEADVFLDDRSVSREHAVLVREDDGGYRIEDLGARNGLFVNRRRVEIERLEDGDEIQIGRYAIGYLERP